MAEQDWKPPFDADAIEDLECPVCEKECLYVEKKTSYTPEERLNAYCGDCKALLTVSVILESTFGDPKVVKKGADRAIGEGGECGAGRCDLCGNSLMYLGDGERYCACCERFQELW
jgi:hypothetical protein